VNLPIAVTQPTVQRPRREISGGFVSHAGSPYVSANVIHEYLASDLQSHGALGLVILNRLRRLKRGEAQGGDQERHSDFHSGLSPQPGHDIIPRARWGRGRVKAIGLHAASGPCSLTLR
jgi:hypothetical protein